MTENCSHLENRQDARVPSGFAIQLCLRDSRGTNLTDNKVAFIRDISSSGAGLIVSTIIVGTHHLFYGPREKSLCLYLQYKNKEGRSNCIELRPKWYRRGEGEDSCYFYLGVEFVQDSDQDDIQEFLKVIKNTLVPKKSWLASILSF